MSSFDSGKRTQVVVVGAGPVGLVLALRLVQQGVSVQLLERQPRHAARLHPVLLHARSQAVLRELGVYGGALARGRSLERCRIHVGASCRAVLELPDPVATLPQDVLRQALVRALEARGVEVAWNCEVTLLKQSEQGVLVRLVRRTPLDAVLHGERDAPGTLQELRADYVVGADGYDSTVRRSAELEIVPRGPLDSYLFFDALESGARSADIELGSLDGLASAVYPIHGGRSRFSAQLDRALHQLPGMPDLRQLVRQRWPWRHGILQASEWSGVAEFRRYLAPRFGYGRVWLVGDAAHGTGPLGVQSLNVGMREADDLAQLLAQACRVGGVDLAAAYDVPRHAEWNELLARDERALRLPEWARQSCPTLHEALPASGDELVSLLEQLASSGAHGSRVRAAAGAH